MTKEERIRAECARRGLSLERTGQAWRVTGRGVYIVSRRIEDIDLRELNRAAPIPDYSRVKPAAP